MVQPLPPHDANTASWGPRLAAHGVKGARRGPRWPLRRQIVAWNLGILLPVAVGTAWSMRQSYEEQLALLGNESTSLAAAVVVYLERGLDIRSIQTVIQDIPLPAGAVITLTNQNSTVLARSVEAEHYVGRQVEASPLPASQVPEVVHRGGVDGIERVFANLLYAKGPWLHGPWPWHSRSSPTGFTHRVPHARVRQSCPGNPDVVEHD